MKGYGAFFQLVVGVWMLVAAALLAAAEPGEPEAISITYCWDADCVPATSTTETTP